MQRVTGIGGVFFKAKDPEALAEWYRKHLGIDVQLWLGAAFRWQTPEAPQPYGVTVWSLHAMNANMYRDTDAPFIINYRVADLRKLAEVLKEEGCKVNDDFESSEHGLFQSVMDPEGNKAQLWEPIEGYLPE